MAFTSVAVASAQSDGPVGAKTFWELLGLLDGDPWVSCYSCIEFFYAQSAANAALFLEAAAATGFLDKVPLRRLMQDAGLARDTEAAGLLEMPVFLSPLIDKKRKTVAWKRRIESIVTDLVAYSQHARREGGDARIDTAFRREVTHPDGTLRNRVVERRWQTDMSSLARFRLLLEVPRSEGASFTVAKRRVGRAIRSVTDPAPLQDCDPQHEELEQFIVEFLGCVASPEVACCDTVTHDPTRFLALVHELARRYCIRRLSLRDHADLLGFVQRWREAVAVLVTSRSDTGALLPDVERVAALCSSGGADALPPLVDGGQLLDTKDTGFVATPAPKVIRKRRVRVRTRGKAQPTRIDLDDQEYP